MDSEFNPFIHQSVMAGHCRSARLDNPDMRSILLTPQQSVEALLKTIAGLKPADTGKFLNYDSSPMPY